MDKEKELDEIEEELRVVKGEMSPRAEPKATAARQFSRKTISVFVGSAVALIMVAVFLGYQLGRTPPVIKTVPRVAAPVAPAPAPAPQPEVKEAPKPKPFGITQAPTELPGTGVAGVSWEEVLERALKETTEVTGWMRGEPDDRTRVMISYGLLHSYGPVEPEKLRKGETALTIFNSPLASAAYKWAMPSAKAAFKTLSSEDQADYLKLLDYASAHLGKFTQEYYQTEARYWEGLEKQGCYGLSAEQMKFFENEGKFPSCTILFTYFGPDGKKHPYRKLEAFIFRRVHSDGLDAKVMKSWLDGAIAYLRKP